MEEKKMEKIDDKGFLDKVLEKLTSRKLMTFIIATVFICVGKLESEQWVMLAMLYIGSESLIDLAIRWRNGGK